MISVRSPRVTVFPDARTAARVVAARLASALRRIPASSSGSPRAVRRSHEELSADIGSSPRLVEGDDVQPRRVRRPAPGPWLIPPVHAGAPLPLHQPRPAADQLLVGTANPDEECLRYERAIAEWGIDIQILGIGTNGHIGFNEPGPSSTRTHRVKLRPETRRSNARSSAGTSIRSRPKRCRWEWRRFFRRAASCCSRTARQGRLHCQGGQRTLDDGAAGVVPAAAPGRGPDPRRGSRKPAGACAPPGSRH